MLLLCHLVSMHAMILLDSGIGIPTCAATPTSYVLPNPEHDRENRTIRSMPLHVIVHNPPGMNNQVPVRFFEWGWVKDVEKIGPLPTQKV